MVSFLETSGTFTHEAPGAERHSGREDEHIFRRVDIIGRSHRHT
jgi:hypothetical protein